MKITFEIDASCKVTDADIVPDEIALANGIESLLMDCLGIDATVHVYDMEISEGEQDGGEEDA